MTDGPHVRADAAFERTWLDDESWIDVARGWLAGADEVYAALVENATWAAGRVFRYDRWVDVPRLSAHQPAGTPPLHPVLADAQRALQGRYQVSFGGFSMNWYRDERDSQAFHRDRDLRWLDETVIALLTLGERRPWLVRPRVNRYDHEAADRGAVLDVAPGPGDLHVMGGATQRGWEHSVPKLSRRTGGRISVQWRWTSRQGKPVQGASWRAPRHYSRG